MAQPSNPKIEELRFRLKADPRSRLFYQLGEELRRAGEFAEAEQVLRAGLVSYPTYLAAWVSLGRVLREQQKDEDAVEALGKALQLDPGNAVAARLSADAWLALGEKVEAIKKYKLVYALLPADEGLRSTIEQIEREIGTGPGAPIALSVVEPEEETADPAALAPVIEMPLQRAEPSPAPDAAPAPEFSAPPQNLASLHGGAEPVEDPGDANEVSLHGGAEPVEDLGDANEVSLHGGAEPVEDLGDANEAPPLNLVSLHGGTEPVEDLADANEAPQQASPFETPAWGEADDRDAFSGTGDAEPMLAAHEESPFESPVSGFSAAALEVEAPPGIRIEEAPPEASVPSLAASPFETADGAGSDDPGSEGSWRPSMDLAAETSSGGAALALEQSHDRVPAAGEKGARIERLERWLARVSRKEAGRV